jgi:hypothetical protein
MRLTDPARPNGAPTVRSAHRQYSHATAPEVAL